MRRTLLLGAAAVLALANMAPATGDPSGQTSPTPEPIVVRGSSGGPQMGDLASVRVEGGAEQTVAAPTFELSRPAPAPQPGSGRDETASSTTRTGGKETTKISGSGSFSSSQDSGTTSGRSSGSSSGGSSSTSGSRPDGQQMCSMPAMC
ncbi:MAG TPA: hypothetical protein VM840_09925 [Actinomycetota bacterium]|nr:hypothetical protein [Actinomycetota bacterium]